jgi:hypothetical protein
MRHFTLRLAFALSLILVACHNGAVSEDNGDDSFVANAAKTSDASDIGKSQYYDPCSSPADPTPVVDGKFTGWSEAGWPASPHEYGAHPPVEGKYGWFYIAVPTCHSFYLINDWYVRSDAPICPAMYNLFRFSTGGGHQNWEVKVYGDGHLTVTMNGQPYAGGSGGYSYGPSPNTPDSHTIFEFGVTGVEAGELACQLHDPASAAALHVTDTSATPGCGDPAGALLREPTILRANLQPGAEPQFKPATSATAVSLAPYDVIPGMDVTIFGGMFGDKAGSVEIGGVPQQVISWNDAEVHVELAYGLKGELPVVVYASTGPSNELWLKFAPVGTCDDGSDCTTDTLMDGVCEHKPDLAICDDKIACTVDKCTSTGCLHIPDNSQCDDGTECTKDVCGAGGCTHTVGALPGCPCVAPGASFCACSSNNDCDSGFCTPGPTGPVCTQGCANADCPADWWCENVAGGDGFFACVWHCIPQAETCNGVDDDCDGIVDNIASCDDKDVCTSDICVVGSSSCTHKPAADGTLCNDGNTCTETDSCNGGSCSGFLKACNDFQPCTTDACVPTQGCVFTPFTGKTGGCDDNDMCTEPDSCVDGKCVGISKVPAATVCQMTSCNPATGIVTTKPAAQGTTCDDGDPNTVCDMCTGDNSCVGAPLGTVCN